VSKLRVVTVVAAVAVTLAGCVSKEGPASDEPAAKAPTGETCEYKEDPSGADTSVGMPPENEAADATSMELTTSAGPITVKFDEEQAPCTVRSIAFLAGNGFYDDTNCHRLTAYANLKVLQCGDPLGTGAGGPGYTIPDELPTDLPAGEVSAGEEMVIYGRGLVAMANAGPETGGSQFFLVYGDSQLPPNYTVFGEVDDTGLATLDEIAAGGITPGFNGSEDGEPVTEVTVESAQVS
jgi:peptidyl-prolyl cis-trans isomerase B (cyclophilin B)